MWYLVHGVHSDGVGPKTVVNWDERQASTETRGEGTNKRMKIVHVVQGLKSEEEHNNGE